MAFDVEGARASGYSDAEIADHLAKARLFDAAGARKAGYSDGDIIAHLSAKAPAKSGADLIPGATSPESVYYQPPKQPEPSIGQKLLGAGEAAIATVDAPFAYLRGLAEGGNAFVQRLIGTVAGVPGAENIDPGAAFDRGMRAEQYVPRTETGREYTRNIADALAPLAALGPTGEVAAGLGQAVSLGAKTAAAPIKAAAAARIAGQAEQAAAPVVAAQKAAPVAQALTGAELNAAAKGAAEGGLGSTKAMKTLASGAAPDAKTVEAAQRLGVEEYLQPDHVTTSQAYRELSQAVKSVPGSATRQAELVGLEQVAKRADDLINEIGGTTDVSALDASIKGRMRSTHAQIDAQEGALYDKLRESIPAKMAAPGDSVVSFINERASALNGPQNLSPLEQSILGRLQPSSGKQPTYALLDDVRKDIGAAARSRGAFKDSDTGLAKKLYGLISDDQAKAVKAAGMDAEYAAASAATRARKALEDDLTALFGKELDRSLVGDLAGAVKSLPAGDAAKFTKLLDAVPPSMRQEVAASGLNAAFGKSARSGDLNFNSFANWYEGLLRNKQAYKAIMSELPPQSRKQLSDLYRVSNGVRMATRERITTGRIQAVQQELQGADGLLASVYGIAKRAAVGVPVEAVSSAMGLPGVGIASGITSALTKGKGNIMKSADALISSPEFAMAIKAAGKPAEAPAAAAKLKRSSAFLKFVKESGNPPELQNLEQWLATAAQAGQAQQRP